MSRVAPANESRFCLILEPGSAMDLMFGSGAGVKRILAGVDGSRESRVAANYAADLAQVTGARLILACAVFAPDPLGDLELVARTLVWEEEEHERGEDLVRQVAAEVARRGVASETLVVGGPAAATLAGLAKGRDVDLVVVGHRERSALARLLIGSVADGLVEISPKPVLVVRGSVADQLVEIYPNPALVVR